MSGLSLVRKSGLIYRRMIGTGGLGSGMFFKLEDNHTLGRNESRSGEIAHYISVLLGAQAEGAFQTHPIGKLGEDEPGQRVYAEMKQAGMTMDHVEIVPGMSTLFSVCFQYPDSTGGNITASRSASSLVSAQGIAAFFQNDSHSGKSDVILAVPEVPLEARIRLLEEGRRRGSFNAVSILSSEVAQFMHRGGFANTDLLAINIDEAKAIAGLDDDSASTRQVVESCVAALIDYNAHIRISITDGPYGSYGYANNLLEHVPPLKTEAVGTGGAGDAFLSGVIAGLCCGLPFLKNNHDAEFSDTPLQSAMELGTLLASLSVTSPDTIHQTANAKLLLSYAKEKQIRLGDDFAALFPIIS
jgi:sugar/nucleoside kinase (ribokinase family)